MHLENVALPLVYAGINKEERNEQALKVIDLVNLTDRTKHKPNELSGGQQQRIAIARALINNPSIILADEPTGNLDSKISDDIMNLFSRIHQRGNTIIYITHEKEIARYAQRIIKLKDGSIESDIVNKKIKTTVA